MDRRKFINSMANEWGLSEDEKEKEIKRAKIEDLYYDVYFPPFAQFFDLTSDKLLDEKIEVLTALKKGKKISEIPLFYDILELYPKEQKDNEIITQTYWD